MGEIRLNGSCLCGDVVYEVTGEALAFYHCHCRRCRKVTGTGHASNILVRADDISWLAGNEKLRRYDLPGAERFASVFCDRCGSYLPRVSPAARLVAVPAGTLDHEPPLDPEARIFWSSRADWSCNDSLMTWDTYPE